MKLQLKLSSNDKNIIIPIGGSANLLGYDDNVQSLVSNETDTSINVSSDLEVRRFNFSGTSINAIFNFWSGGTFNNYIQYLAPYDFSGLTSGSEEARNSFYVMQVFDTYDEATQTKLHTGYFNGYDFLGKAPNLSTNYVTNNSNTEFLSIYISNSFIVERNGLTIDLFVKFLFYSAASGKFYPFSKNPYSTTNKQEDIYRKITINTSTFKYFVNGNVFSCYEIYNPDYSTLINNTVSSIPVQKTAYPSGNTFTQTGNYETI